MTDWREEAYQRWLDYPKKPGDQVSDAELKQLAILIRQNAPARHNRRDWSDFDKDLIGVLAEREFSRKLKVPMVTVPRPAGDGGVDFWLNGCPIDVKGTWGPKWLLRASDYIEMADVLVLAGVRQEGMTAWLVGWEFDEEMLKLEVQPPLKEGATPAYRKLAGDLKPMKDLVTFTGGLGP